MEVKQAWLVECKHNRARAVWFPIIYYSEIGTIFATRREARAAARRIELANQYNHGVDRSKYAVWYRAARYQRVETKENS